MRVKRLNKFPVCPKCGSTDYNIDYAADGLRTCRKCKSKMQIITLKIISTERGVSDNCSFCGKEGDADDRLPVAVEGVTVFRCKGCGELDGYFDPEEVFDWSDIGEIDLRSDDDYSQKSAMIAAQEGKSILNASQGKKILKAIKKYEKNPSVKGKKRLFALVSEKKTALQEIGVSTEVANYSANTVETYLKKEGKRTEKQLTNLFAASLYVTQEKLCKNKKIHNGLTERSIQAIFGTDRKTLRKWKKAFEKNNYLPLR